jgi:hemoglobin
MKRSQWISGLLIGLCALASAPAFAQQKSLYERLGGEPAITAVVDDFTARAAANAKVNFLRGGKYANVDVPKFKKHLVNLIGSVTGGPQKYTGRDMKTVHKGMAITDAEFDALAADLIASLDKFKVPAKEKDELLKIVASTRADIVEVKAGAPADDPAAKGKKGKKGKARAKKKA